MPTIEEGDDHATKSGCYGAASMSGTAFAQLLFDDKTVEESNAYYAYELMDAAE